MSGFDAGQLKGSRWGGRETKKQWMLNGWGDQGGSGVATSLNRASGDRKALARREARRRLADAAERRRMLTIQEWGSAALASDVRMVERIVEPKRDCNWCGRSYQPMNTPSELCWNCRVPGRGGSPSVQQRIIAAGGSPSVATPAKWTEPKVLRPTSGSQRRRKVKTQEVSVPATAVFSAPKPPTAAQASAAARPNPSARKKGRRK